MSPQPAVSPKTILLVDDDPTVVQSLNIILSRRGYDVLAAQTMEEAIAAARRTNTIDLLVVDAVMPEISGPELAEILLFLRPNMKILFITGLDGLAIRLAFERPCAFLQKPFSVTTLVTKIDAMLDLEPKPPGA
jgi:two-component system cell cycle sensor histidine kinase/response regulator CckA